METKAVKHLSRRKEQVTGWIMILPMLLACLIFYAIPCVASFVLSLAETSGFHEFEYVGLENFKKLFFDDKYFWREFWNTLYFAFGSCALTVTASLFMAWVLHSPLRRGKDAYRLFFFMPSVTMAAVTGVVWRQMLNSQYGMINTLLGFIGIDGPKWLSNPNWMMPGIFLITLWSGIGSNIVIFMAGMHNIPHTYYEAAEIDGAGKWQQFRLVTMPLLTPTTFYVLINALIGGFKSFDLLWMFVSVAGSDRYKMPLRVLSYGIYERGFVNLRMGMGSAEAMVLFVVLLAVTLVQFKLQKKWVHYEVT